MKQIKLNKQLHLMNNGELELFFIGTGTPFTTTLYNNNFFIIKGETHILIDFGVTAPHAINVVAGLSPNDIDSVLVTHSHSDHIGGLEYLALFNRYISQFKGKPKLNIIITKDYKKILWEQSLRGGMQWNETSDLTRKLRFEDYFIPHYPSLIKKVSREIYQIDYKGIHLEIFKTNHIPDSAYDWQSAYYSYGIYVDNRLFVSCDTKFDPDLVNMYADKSELMFHDCSFSPNAVHASLPEIKTLPAKIKKKMFLMHYNDDWASQDIKEFAGLAKQGVRYIFD